MFELNDIFYITYIDIPTNIMCIKYIMNHMYLYLIIDLKTKLLVILLSI